jgi:hypothetical protein
MVKKSTNIFAGKFRTVSDVHIEKRRIHGFFRTPAGPIQGDFGDGRTRSALAPITIYFSIT